MSLFSKLQGCAQTLLFSLQILPLLVKCGAGNIFMSTLSKMHPFKTLIRFDILQFRPDFKFNIIMQFNMKFVAFIRRTGRECLYGVHE